jgi:dihydrodiol dehydrogenase / D-xylose 1-dehydrogenase (NADP)
MYLKSKIILTDVVYIGALNHQHYELTKLMLESGKPVLCEKPFCINAKQLNELIKVKKMYIFIGLV